MASYDQEYASKKFESLRIAEVRVPSSTILVIDESEEGAEMFPTASTSTGRPSSRGTTIICDDAPVTIIYPSLSNAIRTGAQTPLKPGPSSSSLKRKRDASPLPTQPQFRTKALVCLFEPMHLAMSTDFAAFYHEFQRRGIVGDYYSIYNIEDLIKKEGSLVYGRDDIPNRAREEILKAGHERFYRRHNDPAHMKRETLKWLQNSVRDPEPGDNITSVMVSHGDHYGVVICERSNMEYLTSAEVRTAISGLK